MDRSSNRPGTVRRVYQFWPVGDVDSTYTQQYVDGTRYIPYDFFRKKSPFFFLFPPYLSLVIDYHPVISSFTRYMHQSKNLEAWDTVRSKSVERSREIETVFEKLNLIRAIEYILRVIEYAVKYYVSIFSHLYLLYIILP
jgi:hypothetical protein